MSSRPVQASLLPSLLRSGEEFAGMLLDEISVHNPTL